jgi:prevent-host-death family protein
MVIVMTQRIAAGTFKAQCLALLDEVDREGKEIVVTKRGRPVARLMPVRPEAAVIFGRLKGTGRIVGDILSAGESWEADG